MSADLITYLTHLRATVVRLASDLEMTADSIIGGRNYAPKTELQSIARKLRDAAMNDALVAACERPTKRTDP